MEACLDRTGPAGRAMMCTSASVQVCLDAGHEEPGPLGHGRRWWLAHQLGAVLVAAFANSPAAPGRAPPAGVPPGRLLWSEIGAGRAGRARRWTRDPRSAWARHVLDAPVMCVRRDGGPVGRARSGLTFREWIRSGVPRPPTREDLDYHLTTLFPPVRPRGHLELRMIDAQPGDDGWIVPLAVTTALFDDPEAAETAYRAVKPLAERAGSLPAPHNPLWADAARHGLADPRTARGGRRLLRGRAGGAAPARRDPGGRRRRRRVPRPLCRPGPMSRRRPARPVRRGIRTGSRHGTASRDRRTSAHDRPRPRSGDAPGARARRAHHRARAHRAPHLCVDDPELTAQHSPLMSPLVWDLAHIGNQEELWLLRAVAGREAMRPEIDGLYDAFEHPRAERPSLPLLPPAEARDVRGGGARPGPGRAGERPASTARALADRGRVRLRDDRPARTAARRDDADHPSAAEGAARSSPRPTAEPAAAVTGPAEVLVPGGPFTMGTSTEPWALDNERPAHRREVRGLLHRHRRR